MRTQIKRENKRRVTGNRETGHPQIGRESRGGGAGSGEEEVEKDLEVLCSKCLPDKHKVPSSILVMNANISCKHVPIKKFTYAFS